MDTLQVKSLEHTLELLQSFDTYKIYAAVHSAIEPIENKELKKSIMFLCENAINMENAKIKEAISWIKALIEKK